MNENLFGEIIIRSVSFNEEEIIKNMIDLYLGNKTIELDPTFSIGAFYNGLRKPKYKFDIEPFSKDVKKSDCRDLPFSEESIKSIMFDPPFVGGSRAEGKPGIIKSRFGYYKSIPELWKFYEDSLKEFYRILMKEGFLFFKCQDSIESGKQYLTHVFIINKATEIGYYAKDLFVYAVKDRIIDPSIKQQYHARKFHSYFIVFQKTKNKVHYN